MSWNIEYGEFCPENVLRFCADFVFLSKRLITKFIERVFHFYELVDVVTITDVP